MSALKRANTWEMSDSENENEETNPSSSSSSSSSRVKLDQDSSSVSAVTFNNSPVSTSAARTEDTSIKSPGQRRRRRTREEVEEDREKREAAREKLREKKEKLKEEKLQERQRRKETAEKLTLFKPENFIKTLTVNIHAVLLQDAGCDVLLRTLDCLEWRNHIENQSLLNSISWTGPALQTEEEDENGVVEEDQILMVVPRNEFEHMVMSHKQGSDQSVLIGEEKEGVGPHNERAESLLKQLSEYLTTNPGKVVTVLVISHYRRSGFWDEDDTSSHLCQQHLDIEEFLVHLQLYWNVAVHFLFGWQEVTDHVIAFTKALSKRPYKVLCGDPELGFCMDGSWSGGVRVDRDGCGLAQVWTRQIQQLNRVSPAMAKAMTGTYRSPSILLQAYEELESMDDQRKLLADLTVVGGANERRVGPELSCRIHRLLTSQNPHLLLD
ncbi:probable crossover junction endonuclease EME2 isoform X2 [Myxocyprinus asiaticus]|uniref:probable crossover junction endonuclease EME2 isoform X2 n=1 Tax=Myxocyprinus asiaticus TaxID=70543 RepID=UPI002221EB3B|nr:probable crossover junction endonuclease EME2 isoform X2 [Myxocyprinus asiaticus]